jgi:D-glycero-D-manno-heptose 1,7-bisphosphate phosphatase
LEHFEMTLAARDLIILDRDGVINFDSVHYIKSIREWQPIPGSIEAIALLSQAGFSIVVATNQAGIGRGLFSVDDLNLIHDTLCREVINAGGKISGIYFCPHTPEESCLCRKPKTGLLDTIERDFACSVEGCVYVGDRLKDMELALAKKCLPVLVKTGYGEKTLVELQQSSISESQMKRIVVVPNLRAACDYILQAATF